MLRRVVCISRVWVGSEGRAAIVWGVVSVNGMSLWMKVIRPPPPPRVRSRRVVVYPGKRGVWCLGLSLVSWIKATCMLCVLRSCLSSDNLFCIPSILICRRLSVLIV